MEIGLQHETVDEQLSTAWTSSHSQNFLESPTTATLEVSHCAVRRKGFSPLQYFSPSSITSTVRALPTNEIGKLLCTAATYLTFDVLFNLSTMWPMQLLYALMGVVCVLPALIKRREWAVLPMLAMYLCFIVGTRYIDWTPEKSFMRFYDTISMGMTQSEVEARLHQAFPDSKKAGTHVTYQYSDGFGIILNPNDGNYNAEIIHVELKDGRVSDKRYSHD